MANSGQDRYQVEIVDLHDARVTDYLNSIAARYPVSYRKIFPKSRLARSGCVALLVQQPRSKISGIAALELPQAGSGSCPSLLFAWAEAKVYTRTFDRKLFIALCLLSLERYRVLPDATELLQLCNEINEVRSQFIVIGETAALGITHSITERLTSLHPRVSVFHAAEALFNAATSTSGDS
jgi:hypothetical protein